MTIERNYFTAVHHQTGAYFENLLKWKSGTSSGLRQLVSLFHSWFWIYPDLSLKNYGKSKLTYLRSLLFGQPDGVTRVVRRVC